MNRTRTPADPIRLSKSCVGDAEKQAVMDVLGREYLGMGVDTGRFEAALADYLGRPTTCVVNGTAALHLALQACDVGEGDEVLVPSLTYVASYQAISATGARPVSCDVDPHTLTLDPDDARCRVTSRTRAVMPVHYTGGVGDLEGVYALAREASLRVIEDAAHAFGTIHCGRPVGSFGDIACFSFDGIKGITSGEGGCVVTDDALVKRRVEDARLLGVEKDTDMRYSGQRSWGFDVTSQGWRYHMSNIMAAVGLAQLGRFPEFAATRQRLARRYDSLLEGDPRIVRIDHDYDKVVPHIYVVRVARLRDREGLRRHMLEAGVQTGFHYKPNHTLTYYRDPSAEPLPVTERVFPELLSLPLHPDLSLPEVEYVVETLRGAVDTFIDG